MPSSPVRLTIVLLLTVLAGSLGACRSGPDFPDPDSEAYTTAVSAFYTGVAAVQVGEFWRAEGQFTEMTETVPDEPAPWANLAVLALRQNNLDEAASHLRTARSLAPENADILYLSGLLERERGQLAAAAEYLRGAVDANPEHLRAAYALAQTLEDRGDRPDATASLLDTLLADHPNNLALQLERARLAAKQGDPATAERLLNQLSDRAADWPSALQDQLQTVRTAVAEGDLQNATTEIVFLKSDLERVAAYRADRTALEPPPEQTGTLITHFIRMPTPDPQPAPPDSGLTFTAEPLDTPDGEWPWVYALPLGTDGLTGVLAPREDALWLGTGPQQSMELDVPGAAALTPRGIAGIDYNYDFQVDLAFAGPNGLRLFRQNDIDTFVDVTDEAIPAAAARVAYAGAWPADLDMEGDMDLVLARPEASPVVLRNNGDGSFSQQQAFDGVTDLRDFAWADFDADGDPDAALLDGSGRLHVFLNQRQQTPRFTLHPLPESIGSVLALGVADANRDGTLDLLALQSDGTLTRLSVGPDDWQTSPVLRWADLPETAAPGATNLFAEDFDNNGAIDLAAATPSGGQVWLRTTDGAWMPQASFAAHVSSVVDFQNEGRLDLIGLAGDGTPTRLANRGTKDYHSTTIQPRAARVQGDRRINSFGLGGEIELRAGVLYQKQLIASPAVHFGLGPHVGADVARIIWPNGTVQAEFDLLSTQTVQTRQRLKGSCPWVFTHDGDRVQFVTDFLWRTALGLQINAQGKALVIHSEDWIKIDGDQLAPRDGLYDIRITGELWESHFFDHVELMVVDHPADTEIFVDERFKLPPPPLAVRATDPLRPVAAAYDHEGRDVTDLVRERDERYLDTFDLGAYQGLAEEHYVEVHLGDDVPTDGPLWLAASGWVYPTDTSINLAIGQGDGPRPQSLQLEVPDGNGGWTVAKADLGFPAGKRKTIMLDLSDVFRPGTPRRVRLRTSMEIYWDRIAWSTGRPDAELRTQRIEPDTADLRYRGFSAVRQPSRTAPEIPIYDSLATTAPQWRDLVGYHTRFGDVKELINSTDDRYVIMNAGDEMVFRFPAPPPPPEGWTRDFVLIGDGWVKDGDYNTGYSTTVRPLPYHGLDDYTTPPVPLEQDPAYRMHPEDWATYHTRYVTPHRFHEALTFKPAPQ